MKKQTTIKKVSVKNTLNNNPNNNPITNQRVSLDSLKAEIANEFGVELGPDATSRQNGSVGGEITKRLVKFAKESLS